MWEVKHFIAEKNVALEISIPFCNLFLKLGNILPYISMQAKNNGKHILHCFKKANLTCSYENKELKQTNIRTDSFINGAILNRAPTFYTHRMQQ